jgi:hypothetical protein
LFVDGALQDVLVELGGGLFLFGLIEIALADRLRRIVEDEPPATSQ